MCKAELKRYYLIFCFMLSSFLFFNLFSISFLFITLKGSKKVKDKAIKYICFSNIMEILYPLKAFSELQWLFMLTYVLDSSFFQGYDLLWWYFFVISDMVYSVYCMLRFLFLLFFLLILRDIDILSWFQQIYGSY